MHCNTCDNIRICPKFVSMTTPELLAYCKKRKKELNISAIKLSELSGIPIGTIESLFGKDKVDCKYETLRPILAVLLSMEPCQALQATGTTAEHTQEIERLRKENNDLKDRLLAVDPQHREDIANVKAEDQRIVDYLREEIKSKNKVITIMASIIAVLVIVIIAALVVNK